MPFLVGLFRRDILSEKYFLEYEYCSQNVYSFAYLLIPSSKKFYDDICNHSEFYSCRNAVGKWHGEDRHCCRNYIGPVLEVHVLETYYHEDSYHDEGRRSGAGRDDRDQRAEENG